MKMSGCMGVCDYLCMGKSVRDKNVFQVNSGTARTIGSLTTLQLQWSVKERNETKPMSLWASSFETVIKKFKHQCSGKRESWSLLLVSFPEVFFCCCYFFATPKPRRTSTQNENKKKNLLKI